MALVGWVIMLLHPFSTIELDAFLKFSEMLNPEISILSRMTVRWRILEISEHLKLQIKSTSSHGRGRIY